MSTIYSELDELLGDSDSDTLMLLDIDLFPIDEKQQDVNEDLQQQDLLIINVSLRKT